MQHRKIPIFILKGYLPEFDFSFKVIRVRSCIQSIFDLWFGIIDLHHLLGCGREPLKFIHDISHLTHWVGNCPDQSGKCHIISHRQFAPDQKDTAHGQHHYRHKVCNAFHIWEKFQPYHAGFFVRLCIIFVCPVKFFNFIRFPGKRFYHTVSGNIFLRIGVHLCQFFTQFRMHRCHLVFEQINDKKHKRRNN